MGSHGTSAPAHAAVAPLKEDETPNDEQREGEVAKDAADGRCQSGLRTRAVQAIAQAVISAYHAPLRAVISAYQW